MGLFRIFCAGIMGASAAAGASETLVFDRPECAGMSGFRAHWNETIAVAEDGKRLQKDSVVKDRGQTAVWGGPGAGPLAFDAVHRSLLVRFPGAGEKIAEALRQGNEIAKIELVLPFLDEEIWPAGSGGADYPCADGYRYRMNWGCDKLYRSERPNWHAVAYLLRRPWRADGEIGPTYNAVVKGAVYWGRFGASDTEKDRFGERFGPAEVSSYDPEGRIDVTSVVTDSTFGQTVAERLGLLSNCGFILNKLEVYDARYYLGAYEWAVSTGPRAILIKRPKLVVRLEPGETQSVGPVAEADVAAIAAKYRDAPSGAPTATIPRPEEVARLNEKFMTKPEWMPDRQYEHVRELMGLEGDGEVKPFYYRLVPGHVVNRVREQVERKARDEGAEADVDYAVYLAWLDWTHGRPPRYWEGHLTGADNITQWYNYREAIPEPVKESIIRCWRAWLMPDRQTQMDPKLRRRYDDTSGKLVHPMVDDPRVGVSKDGEKAKWNQGDTYYKLTGDWRGNKSYYRSGFTREMSTANFNSSASSGALLNAQIIDSEYAMADGRAGLMKFPFWMWTYNAGVGQEYIDHYYWAIATAGNKNFADFCERPEDRMAGWSIIFKTVNDLANGYHPNLKKLVGPASRTYYDHVLGRQDGLYHILHVLSPYGALNDMETGVLPALTAREDSRGGTPRPVSAWGHDYRPAAVALQSMSGPWGEPWQWEIIDEKPLPWFSIVEKKKVAEGDWVSTCLGVNYGLASIRRTPQRVHVLAHWRRRPERPSSMRDIGTLDMRIGFNETQIGNDGAGVISEQGKYRTYQYGSKLIMLARPQPEVIAAQAAEHKFGRKKVEAQQIRSVQCTAALFNFEQPEPTWDVFVGEKKVDESLPVRAEFSDVITIRDGVTYLAIRPIKADDYGRDAEVELKIGQAQGQAYHDNVRIEPALVIDAYLYKRDKAIDPNVLKDLDGGLAGFVIEIGDAAEYRTFERFREHIASTKVVRQRGKVVYESGGSNLAADWDGFSVNGKDPYSYMEANELWQDTPMSQMGESRLRKNGAVVERAKEREGLAMFLHTFPGRQLYIVTNPLPNYIDYSLREPGGVRIVADGACSMGQWAVSRSREIDIRYHAFGGEYTPKAGETKAASVLFVTGTAGRPKVTLNEEDITGKIRPWKQSKAEGWLVSLCGEYPEDEQIYARLDGRGKSAQ